MSEIQRPRGGRPRGIAIENRDQLRYDLARIGDRATLARRLQGVIEADAKRVNRKYPYLPQAATVWQWLDSGRKVAWPGHSLRDLARFIADQTAKRCDWEAWIHPPTSAFRFHGAPRAPSFAFCGREAELRELLALFGADRNTATLAAIEGLPGVGKTELALHVAQAFASEAAHPHVPTFPGGIFWFSAQKRDLTAAWDEIARSCFQLEEGSVQDRVSQAIRKLEASAKPVLLILDNAFLAADERWEEDRGKPFPLPAGPQIRVLVTTRNEYFGGTSFSHHSLSMLSADASRHLLLRIAQRDPLRDAGRLDGLDALLDEIDGHALSLEISGVYLHKNGAETPRALLQRIGQGERFERHAQQTGYAIHSSGYEATIHGAFSALWDSLDARTRGSWCLAAEFEPAPVSMALSAAVGLDMERLEGLRDFHLIDWDASGRRWLMHRLTRAFGARAGDPETRATAQKAFVAGCASRAALDAQAYALDPLQLDRALEHAPAVLDPAAERALLFAIGPALTAHKGVSEKPRQLYQRAVQLAEQAEQPDEVFLAMEGLWHGSSLRGDLDEAEELAQRLHRRAQTQGSASQRLTALRALAENCWLRGEVAECCEWLEKGIKLARQERDPAYRTVLHPAVSLLGRAGLAHWLLGSLERGFTLATEAVDMATDVGDPATLAIPLLNRSLVQYWRGSLRSAVADAARVVEITKAHHLPILECMGVFQLTWSRIAQDPAAGPAELSVLHACIDQLERWKFHGFGGLHACALAEVYLRFHQRSEAMAVVQGASGRLQSRTPGVFGPELWRLRAALSNSRSERIACLERAIGIALSSGSRWFALRAATDLLDAASTPEQRARAAEQLRRLCAGFPDGSSASDLDRARTALEEKDPAAHELRFP